MELTMVPVWREQDQQVDYIHINLEHVVLAERHFEDSQYDTTKVWLSLDKEPSFGLTVWKVTMSNGRELLLPTFGDTGLIEALGRGVTFK